MTLKALDSPRLAWIAVALGLLARVALLAALGGRPPSDDAADYHGMALDLGRGARFEPDWPPGLPYYLLAFYRLFGASPLVGRMAMLVLYLALSALLYGLGRQVGGARAAHLAVAIFALFPSFVYLSVTTLTQLPTAALLVGAAWAALAFIEAANWKRAGLLGLCLAGLLLVRPSNLLLCLGAPVLLFGRARRPAAIVALAVLAAGLGAWTVKAHSLTGRWLFVNNSSSQNIFYGNNQWTPLYRTWWFGSHKQGEDDVPQAFVDVHARLAATPAAERDHAYSAYAVEHIKARPDLFAVRSLSRVRTFFAFDTFTGAQVTKEGGARGKGRARLLGLAVIGVDAAFWVAIGLLALIFFFTTDDRRAAWVLGLGVLLYAAPYWISFSHPTYHFPVAALLGVAAAAVLARWSAAGGPLLPALAPRRRAWLLATAAIFVLIQLEWAVNMFARA